MKVLPTDVQGFETFDVNFMNFSVSTFYNVNCIQPDDSTEQAQTRCTPSKHRTHMCFYRQY